MTRRWPLILLALPAGVATWSGWVGLGELTGFGTVKPLPGIADFEINTAITLPIGVETYAAYALGTWLSHSTHISPGTRRFAKWSAFGSLLLGMLGQVAYHLLVTFDLKATPWQIVTAVSCLPVLVLGFGAALGHLLSRDAHRPQPAVEPQVHADPVPETAGYAAAPQPVHADPDVFDWAAYENLFTPPPADRDRADDDQAGGDVHQDDEETAPEYVPDGVPEELLHKAASRFLPDVVTGEVPGVRRIKDELNIGQPRAQQVRAYLAGLATQ